MTPGPDGAGADGTQQYRSYYGKPIIKEPVWEPAIPAYFFFGGTAGATAALGLAARASGNASLARVATYVDAVAIAISPPLLIADLGRPERFLNMLRMFKATSPMSVGTWIVSLSGAGSGIATVLELLGRSERVKLAGEAVAGVLGPFLATYTAALLADTSVPVWHEARLELPFAFAGSSAAGAGAACTVFADPACAGPARRLAIGGAALQLVSVGVMRRRLGFVAGPYRHGHVRVLAGAARTLTTAGALAMLRAGHRRGGAIGAGALLLAGAAAERFAIFGAGRDSARDPAYTVVPQRERIKRHAATTPSAV